jgi:hypothetical protein
VPCTPFRDGHGNRVELITLLAPCQRIVLRSTSYVRTHRRGAGERLNGVTVGIARGTDGLPIEAMDYLAHSPLADGGDWLNPVLEKLETNEEMQLENLLKNLISLVTSLIRYEKKAKNYLALLQLACALLWYRRLAQATF